MKDQIQHLHDLANSMEETLQDLKKCIREATALLTPTESVELETEVDTIQHDTHLLLQTIEGVDDETSDDTLDIA